MVIRTTAASNVPDSWAPAVRRRLLHVRAPAQYIGGERNQIVKDWAATPVRVALCFPDTYGVGMSHLGTKILYDIINRRPDALAERAFQPWFDMADAMRADGIPLFSLETHRALRDFDVVGLAVQYEALYTNVVLALDLAGIPRRSVARGEGDPIILSGGPAATAPEPVAPFIDCFILGDGEEAIDQVCDLVAERKRTGSSRDALLLAIARTVPGAYVPQFYDVSYLPSGAIDRITPNRAGIPARIPQTQVLDFGAAPWPDRPVVPYVDVVHDRITLEIMRGCVHGCRFCHAGYTKRPMRYRTPEQLVDMAERAYANTGHSEIGLTSLSSSDYPELPRLMGLLNERFRHRRVSLSLPSLRVNETLKTLPYMLGEVRRSGLTLAPEVATDRLRTIVNKPIKNDDLYAGAAEAFRLGWSSVKLYFMIGLPGELDSDIEGILEMADTLSKIRAKQGKAPAKVNVAISPFIPKPHTPFQWAPQATPRVIRELNHYLKQSNRNRSVQLRLNDPDWAGMEGALARGDRRLADVLEGVVDRGGGFDGWSEGFQLPRWLDAFAAAGLDPAFYLHRERPVAETLPWEHLGAGVTKQFLARDLVRSDNMETTPGCWEGACSACGLDPITDCKPGWLVKGAGREATVALMNQQEALTTGDHA